MKQSKIDPSSIAGSLDASQVNPRSEIHPNHLVQSSLWSTQYKYNFASKEGFLNDFKQQQRQQHGESSDRLREFMSRRGLPQLVYKQFDMEVFENRNQISTHTNCGLAAAKRAFSLTKYERYLQDKERAKKFRRPQQEQKSPKQSERNVQKKPPTELRLSFSEKWIRAYSNSISPSKKQLFMNKLDPPPMSPSFTLKELLKSEKQREKQDKFDFFHQDSVISELTSQQHSKIIEQQLREETRNSSSQMCIPALTTSPKTMSLILEEVNRVAKQYPFPVRKTSQHSMASTTQGSLIKKEAFKFKDIEIERIFQNISLSGTGRRTPQHRSRTDDVGLLSKRFVRLPSYNREAPQHILPNEYHLPPPSSSKSRQLSTTPLHTIPNNIIDSESNRHIKFIRIPREQPASPTLSFSPPQSPLLKSHQSTPSKANLIESEPSPLILNNEHKWKINLSGSKPTQQSLLFKATH